MSQTVKIDVTDRKFIQEPYEAYEAMRKAGPFYHDPVTGPPQGSDLRLCASKPLTCGFRG